MSTCTLKKSERLKSRKIIGQMFRAGQSFGAYPLRLVWLPLDPAKLHHPPPPGRPVQFSVTVPKRNFKSAVARNRIKRRVREAWRLQKQWLYDRLSDSEQAFAFMLIYGAKEELASPEVAAAMRKVNRRFLAQLEKTKTPPPQTDQP